MAKRKVSVATEGSPLESVDAIPDRTYGGGGKWTKIVDEVVARGKGTYRVNLDGAEPRSAYACLKRYAKLNELPVTIALRDVDDEKQIFIAYAK